MEQEEIMEQMKIHLRNRRIALLVSLVLLVASMAFAAVMFLKWEKAKKDNSSTPVEPETSKIVQNAKEQADAFKGEHCMIKTQEYLGWEYITLSYESGFSLSVRNEFPKENSQTEEGFFTAFISNGTETRNLKNDVTPENIWKLALQEPVEMGGERYLFFGEGDGTYGFINMNTLDEVVSMNPQTVAASYFQTEDKGDGTIGVKAGGTEYVFRSQTNAVSFTGFQVSDENHLLVISTPVCLGNGEFIGYLDGMIVPAGNRFALIEAKFGAYVGLNYEDPEGTKIIEPAAEPIDNPIVLSGSATGRYYLPRFEKVPFHSYDWNNLVIKDNGFRELRDDEGNVISRMGIDLSHHNNDKGEIDWNQVKDAGIEFAIIRCGYRGVTQGTVERDRFETVNVRGAASVGIDIGLYFYTQAITEAEAIEEAQFCLDRIQEYKAYGAEIKLPIVIDTELYETKKTARGNMLTRDERTKCLLAFCKVIEEAGYTPMVYASTRWSILNYDRDALSKYPFWFAYYGEKVSYRFDFDIWQYTSSGTVPGIKGDVDLDIMLTFPAMKE